MFCVFLLKTSPLSQANQCFGPRSISVSLLRAPVITELLRFYWIMCWREGPGALLLACRGMWCVLALPAPFGFHLDAFCKVKNRCQRAIIIGDAWHWEADAWKCRLVEKQQVKPPEEQRFAQTLAGDPFISISPLEGNSKRYKAAWTSSFRFYLNAPFWPLGCAELEI